MAATILGFAANEIKVQPALSINSTENGNWEAVHVFIVKASDLNVSDYNRGVLLSTLDESIPPPFDTFLKITTADIKRIEGDLYEITVNCSGSAGSQFDSDGELSFEAVPTYSLSGDLSEVAILQHPKAKKLIDEGPRGVRGLMALLENDGRYFFDWREPQMYILSDMDKLAYPIPENTEGRSVALLLPDEVELGKRIALGKTSYLQSSFTWTETTEGTSKLTAQQLNKLGMISQPRGNPPTIGEGRQWMLTNVSQTQNGELYRTTIEWTLSDDEGYSEFLYDD